MIILKRFFLFFSFMFLAIVVIWRYLCGDTIINKLKENLGKGVKFSSRGSNGESYVCNVDKIKQVSNNVFDLNGIKMFVKYPKDSASIYADKGIYKSDQKSILISNVKFFHTNGIRLDTKSAIAFQKSHYIKSLSPVIGRIKDRLIIESKNFEIMPDKRIIFKGEVRAKFYP